MTITLHGQLLTLLPEKAILLDSTLVLADTHFGKSASLRARGIPVPEGHTSHDIARILALLDRHQPARLVIAGDFLHAAEGRTTATLDSLAAFLTNLSCETHLVLGNHDQRAGPLPPHWPLTIHDTLPLNRFTIVHDPADCPPGRFSICGHLHPVARIRDGRNTAFRTPCFWLREHSLVLPSFGTFTGGIVVHPASHDRLFAPLRDRVVELPPEAL